MPRPNWSRPLPRPLTILDNSREFLRLTTLADVRDFLKHIPKDRRQFDTWQHVAAELDKAVASATRLRFNAGANVTAEEHPMRKIAIVSALVIFLSAMNAVAKGCSSNHGSCAGFHHSAKHAKHSTMGGALGSAYQR
jgi:hypothetical protein